MCPPAGQKSEAGSDWNIRMGSRVFSKNCVVDELDRTEALAPTAVGQPHADSDGSLEIAEVWVVCLGLNMCPTAHVSTSGLQSRSGSSVEVEYRCSISRESSLVCGPCLLHAVGGIARGMPGNRAAHRPRSGHGRRGRAGARDKIGSGDFWHRRFRDAHILAATLQRR